MRWMLALAILAGCATNTMRREEVAQGPVILPNRMCASRGKVAVSTDKPGEKMICELQQPLGSHLPQCVCWDERFAKDERDKAQQMMRETGSIQACGAAGNCSMGPSGNGR